MHHVRCMAALNPTWFRTPFIMYHAGYTACPELHVVQGAIVFMYHVGYMGGHWPVIEKGRYIGNENQPRLARKKQNAKKSISGREDQVAFGP